MFLTWMNVCENTSKYKYGLKFAFRLFRVSIRIGGLLRRVSDEGRGRAWEIKRKRQLLHSSL